MWIVGFILMVIAETRYINTLGVIDKEIRVAKDNKQFISKFILSWRRVIGILFWLGTISFCFSVMIVPAAYQSLLLFCIALFMAILWQATWKLVQSQSQKDN
ncbi:hypothetical protein [Limosilactobacillus fastidiosus]|uniref:DUF3784 domain-containing protein n=1 Tax=Limosilactobacillus fastidiosus TaxID=2759855 RepID=A0A7W3YBX7_9LACO|nr:hypothetical protein [Limosilactobacillus fastidiosus]MBB1063187.1 hypothetical protein [Limosilactobacillus fastidiosus]MBB1085397.1 hypothetical protein [Limosilactobacillus fastidiosus]MCD7083699.1 hypothetical protein [Limosilactobacillus fastidiosus]MCD7085379.1 hypothetical protein [Limosilactobacillus fastidiosus]MCD7114856.1 hypothetical protein [Limosilactobacillus fastidiosus]